MLILFVLLLVTHQAAGHLQCPQVATNFGGEVDLSLFSVLLEQPEDVGDGGNVSMSDDDQCKLIAKLTVHYYVVAIAIIFVKMVTPCSTGLYSLSCGSL